MVQLQSNTYSDILTNKHLQLLLEVLYSIYTEKEKPENNMKIKIPENANMIINTLISKGYKAYAVGGCVRDSVMGTQPHDWDICTSARPDEILTALGKNNVIESGLKHGTVTVHSGNELYEITTFRADGDYTDNRHPETVKFIRSRREDLARRDFTVNAMAYNDAQGLCDYFGGTDDIRNRIIRCVGDPDKRFNEDALRILRALRFASRLGFEIEQNTAASIRKNAGLLRNISVERIASELAGILDGEYCESILMEYPDVLCVFLPEIKPMIGLEQKNPHHIYDVWTHTVKVISNSPHGRLMRITALLHDIAKPQCASVDENGTGHFHGHPAVGAEMAGRILKRLHFDNDTISKVKLLIKYHDLRPQPEPKYVRRLISKTGTELFVPLMELKRADALGQNPDTIQYKLEYTDSLERIFRELTADGSEFNIKTLAIDGNDLISLGISPGPEIGRILKAMLELVIEGELENDRDELIKEVKKQIGSV